MNDEELLDESEVNREFYDAVADYRTSSAQLKAAMDRLNSLIDQLPDPPEPLRPVHEQIQPVREEMQTVTEAAVDHANQGSNLGGKLLGLVGLFLAGVAAGGSHYTQDNPRL